MKRNCGLLSNNVTVVSGLCISVLLCFWGCWQNDFINYDDNSYVYLNPYVSSGIQWETIKWAFRHINSCHWVPLTWLSHALDCSLYELSPAGHHVSSLILHLASVAIIFKALRLITGSFWNAALVSLLFGIHPLRVESVVWVAERKDVLSGFFFALTLLCYSKYALLRHNVDQTENNISRRLYFCSVFFLGCGLLSKPMLVTVPCLLLLLDFWPLNRFGFSNALSFKRTLASLAWEKWPFFALAMVTSLITYLAQSEFMASASNTSGIPVLVRLGNAVMAFFSYLRQTVVPIDLAVFYPPLNVTLFQWQPLLLLALFFILTVGSCALWRKLPAVTVGWLWFVGMLVPVSGIVQAGEMIQADRFTYLPSIGLFIAIVWLGQAVIQRWQWARFPIYILTGVGLLTFGILTQLQVRVWKDTDTLFAHANQVTADNYVALAAQADREISQGDIDAAAKTVERIIQIKPGFPRGQCLMGSVLQMQGKMAEAIPYLQRSVGPEVATVARARMVLSMMGTRQFSEAEKVMSEILQMLPNNADAWLMKAALLRAQGRISEAGELFRKVTEVYQPKVQDTPLFNFELGELFCLIGQSEKASPFYEQAVARSPHYLNALNNYAWVLATDPSDSVRNGKRAVELAERACEISKWNQPIVLGTLAAAYAEVGRFEDAVKTAERAQDEAQLLGAVELARRNAELRELYRQGKPYRDHLK